MTKRNLIRICLVGLLYSNRTVRFCLEASSKGSSLGKFSTLSKNKK